MNLSDIRWGSYKNFEGPWTLGEVPYELPITPTDEDKVMAVITATEGGKYDVVNMYDVCLWTCSFIQWCNRAPQHSVDDLLTHILLEKGASYCEPLFSLASTRGYIFRVIDGKGRFYRQQNNVQVATPELQQDLYFGGSTGYKGQWHETDKSWAKLWCLASAQTFGGTEQAREAAVTFTAPKVVKFFAYGAGRTLLEEMPPSSVGHAWRALYLSFAANNPAKAASAVKNAQSYLGLEPWTEVWLINQAHHLTFDSGISIYPHRYNKIRPVIENLWGVDLPDVSEELRKWQPGFSERWFDPAEVQRALKALGYDLGPRGIDGDFGRKSKAALQEFERDAGVPPECQDGMPDRFTLPELEKALEAKGLKELS
jgi:hypothetical protein